MDDQTETFRLSGADQPGGSATSAAAFDLVWTRDGRGSPPPNSPGDVLDLGEDVLGRYLRARTKDGVPFVLEMQKDLVDPDALPASWGLEVGNRALEALWRRRELAAASQGDRRPQTGLGQEPSAPLFLCRERGIVFSPLSPAMATLDGMAECRDDEVLRAARLPAWSTSTRRFLADGGDGGMPERFYTCDPQPVRGAAISVGTFDSLTRDFAQLLSYEAMPEAIAGRLRVGFPCLGCPEVPRCYARPQAGAPSAAPGRPMASKRLAPIAMYAFHAIAHREEVVDFAEHCDLLGGTPWSAFRTRHREKWKTPGARLLRDRLEDELAGRVEAPPPAVALAEKLRLFEAAVQQVVEYHRAYGRAHLGLSPASLCSHVLFPGPKADYDVTLRAALRAPSLDDLIPPPPGQAIWLVPPDAVEPYAHADVVRAALPRSAAPPDGGDVHAGGFGYGRATPVRIATGRVWPDESRGTAEFELDVTGLEAVFDDLHESDRIRIQIAAPGWEARDIWCRRDLERVSADELPLRAFPTSLDSGQLLDLRGATGNAALLGSATVYRTYGAFYDLHALGMLLLRAVLDNAQHPIEQLVADAVPPLVTLAGSVRARDGDSSWDRLVDAIGELVVARPLDAFLGQQNVCFYPGERATDAGRVPAPVWAAVLATAAACLTCRGAGFAQGTRAEADPAQLALPAEALLERVREIRARLPDPRKHLAATVLEPLHDLTSESVDPRDARIRELEDALGSSAARMERLQAQLDELRRAVPVGDDEPTSTTGAGAEELWESLVRPLMGGGAAVPRLDPANVELVHTLLVEGLATLATLGDAASELAGQEFAAEQRNLQRLVRQALDAPAGDMARSSERKAEALRTIRALPNSLGTTIAVLVEAHSRSTQKGSRTFLLTLHHAVRKELDLDPARGKRLDGLVARMEGALGELTARFYDEVFQRHLQRELKKRRGRKSG